MTQSPYPQMAKEFMDLWQKQMASVMGDKQFIHAMLEIIQNLQMPHADKKTTTATDTAHASGAADEHNAQLAYRLAMCERRIAALEKEHAKSPRKTKAAPKPRAGSKKPRQ